MLAERRTDRNTPQLQPQQQLEWENHLKPSPPSLNNCRVRYGNYYSLLPLCSGFHVTLLCFSHFFIFCFSVSLPHLTLAHFAAEAASENPKSEMHAKGANSTPSFLHRNRSSSLSISPLSFSPRSHQPWQSTEISSERREGGRSEHEEEEEESGRKIKGMDGGAWHLKLELRGLCGHWLWFGSDVFLHICRSC